MGSRANLAERYSERCVISTHTLPSIRIAALDYHILFDGRFLRDRPDRWAARDGKGALLVYINGKTHSTTIFIIKLLMCRDRRDLEACVEPQELLV